MTANRSMAIGILSIVCVVLVCGTSFAGTNEIADLGFPLGEKLVYKIYWGIIPVGTVVTLSEPIELDGKKMIRLRYRTRTNRFFDRIQKIDDSLESIIDPVKLLPVRYVQKTGRDEDYSHEVTVFDHKKGQAHWESKTDGSTRDFEIEPDTRDILSFLSFMRRSEFDENEEYNFAVVFDNGVGEARVQTAKFENRKIGKFDRIKSLKMSPAISSDNIVLEGGKLTMWITWKDRVLCTRFVVDAPLANIYLVLNQVLGPGDDFWTKTTSKKTKVNKSWLERISPEDGASD